MAKEPNKTMEEQQAPEEEMAPEAAESTQDETNIEETETTVTEKEKTLNQEVEKLQDELSTTRTQADEYLEGWQRARAEFANYKKRIERDQASTYQMAAGNILKRYLEVADDLERALKNRPEAGEGAAWANGIELIYRKLMTILENEGVTRIEPKGEPFDPNLHEAITSEESDEFESGHVIEVVQPGYMIGDRVLRPAMVRVAR